MKNISRYYKNLLFALLLFFLALVSAPIMIKICQDIIFKSNGVVPITVDTEDYLDLLEGRISKFSTPQYNFQRRLDKSSQKVYIDVFDRSGELLGSSGYDLPLTIRQK